MVKNGTHLLERNTGKPVHELRCEGTIFEILKECGYRDASTTEYPSTAYAFRVPFSGGAGRPIDHGENGTTTAPARLTCDVTGAPR
jgi:hypothetical protein